MASANTSVVNLSDGRSVCLSYGVAVAAFIPGKGYVKTDRRWSVTTSKHANAFCSNPTIVPDAEFCKMVEPVECKGR